MPCCLLDSVQEASTHTMCGATCGVVEHKNKLCTERLLTQSHKVHRRAFNHS